MNRLGTLTLATIALMSVVLVAGASGHRAKFPSTVTAKFDKQTSTFEGQVASDKPGCVVGRVVNINLRGANGSTTVVGSAKTDGNGAWTVHPTTPPAAGTYFAEAAKKVLRKTSKHRHACTVAQSKDLKVK